MNNFEKIGLIVLFFISLIYSYVKPSDVVENIETKQQITIEISPVLGNLITVIFCY